jgi:hypothetical protein
MIAILTVVFVSVLAFVTDFGMAYANKRVLQNGADAAALAAAQEIAEVASPTADCSAIEGSMEDSTRTVAEAYFAENGPSGDAGIAPDATGYNIDCSSGRLLVEVATQQTSSNFFGPVFGAEHEDGIPLQASAKAAVAPPNAVIGVRPLAICSVDAEALRDSPAESRYIIYDNDDDRGCGAASGNWGLLNLDGGPNGTPELREWIEGGYDEEFGGTDTCEDADIECTEGTPGFRNSLTGSLEFILGEKIVIPVFDSVSGSGSNAMYHVQGFISVQVCGWRLNGSAVTDVGEGLADACYDPTVEPAVEPRDDWFQFKYSNYVPSGDPTDLCELGNSACDYGARVFRLAE